MCPNTIDRESIAHMQSIPDVIQGSKIKTKTTAIFGENSAIYN